MAGHADRERDCLSSGTFVINAGQDGIHAENTDDTSLGGLYIADGSFTIVSGGDCISASGALQIDAGDFTLTAGGGSESVTMQTSQMDFGAGRGQQTNVTQEETQEEDTTSQKGIKAEGSYIITDGTFSIDSADDCLHAGGDLLIESGSFDLRSGDDAVHSDAAVTIQDGTFSIPYCYEGIEGLSVTVNAGSYTITSYDDGINTAGGTDGSGFGGMRQDQFASGSDSFIIINGGDFTIVSSGDCLDSNGDLTINGGTLQLTCNGSGNTAIDADGSYTNNGGDVTTNDGSESGSGFGAGGGMNGGGSRGGAGKMAGGTGGLSGETAS